jgi:hypothetical protein
VFKVLGTRNGNVKGGRFCNLDVVANGAQIVINFAGKQIFSISDSNQEGYRRLEKRVNGTFSILAADTTLAQTRPANSVLLLYIRN